MKTVLLTGATGFLGSHLLESLLKDKYRVIILKRSTSDTWRIRHLLEQVKSYDIDIEPVENAFIEQRIDAVYHTACHYGRNGDSIAVIVDSNLMFGLQVLDASLKYKVETFINTDTLLKKHLNHYTLSKNQFVEWLQQVSDQIQVINLKLEHMYGPKDDDTKFVSWVINQLKSKVPEIKLTAGEQLRDFIYIDDVVSAFMLTLEKSKTLAKFTEFDVGTGTLMSVKKFLKTLKSVYEKENAVIQTQLNFGVIPYREGEMMRVEVNNTNLRNLGWQTKITLEQGLLNILESDK
mgnify:CR=1 FL=1